MREKTVAVSGGFSPVHVGHVQMFKAAKKLGRRLVVILNSDRFLKQKRRYVFMPFEQRKVILESIRYVDKVIPCIDEDQTVCKTLEQLKPSIFANGGDRTRGNIPEDEVCEKLGIRMAFRVGGGKVESSSWLLDSIVKQTLRRTKKDYEEYAESYYDKSEELLSFEQFFWERHVK